MSEINTTVDLSSFSLEALTALVDAKRKEQKEAEIASARASVQCAEAAFNEVKVWFEGASEALRKARTALASLEGVKGKVEDKGERLPYGYGKVVSDTLSAYLRREGKPRNVRECVDYLTRAKFDFKGADPHTLVYRALRGEGAPFVQTGRGEYMATPETTSYAAE